MILFKHFHPWWWAILLSLVIWIGAIAFVLWLTEVIA